MDKLFTIKQVAENLGVSLATLKREIQDGNLVASKIRGRTMVNETDLAVYLEKARDHV